MTLPESGFSTRRKRIAAIALSVAIALGAATAIAVPLQLAAHTASTASAHAAKKHPVATVGKFSSAQYKTQADALPGGLAEAVVRDLHISPAQYLADSAAAVHGVAVVSALKAHGVHVLGSRMNGTKLIVNVASAADTSAVTATGATAVIGAPKVPNYSKTTYKADSTSNTYCGEAYFYQDSSDIGTNDGFRCSIGFNGYSVSSGSPQFATAGHCATTIDGNAYPIALNKPTHAGGSGAVSGIPFGGMVAGEGEFGNNMDYGIVAEDPSSYVGQPSLYTWGKAAAAPTSTAPLGITGQSAGIAGAALCKSGSTSGWTCGSILEVDANSQVEDDNNVVHSVNSIIATTCLLPGDSGGGAVMGTVAAGIDSGSNNVTGSCTSPKNGVGGTATSVFFPMVSTSATKGADSVQGQQGSNWQLALSVAAPKVNSPASGSAVAKSTSLKGTLASPNSASTVSLFLDGSSTATATVPASSGSWTFPLSSYAAGHHTYSLVATSGYSKSPASTGSVTLLIPVTTAVSGGVGDFNNDGKSDIIARDTAGNLWLYPGTGAGAITTRVQLASGWQSMTAIVSVGDLTADGHPDVVARDSAGTLWVYPGDGAHSLGTRIELGSDGQFAGMTAIQGVADFTGDGHPDLVSRDSAGNVWLYPVTGDGVLGARTQIASGWQTMTSIVGVGDFNGDGHSDLIVRNSANNLILYPGTGSGTLGTPVQIGTSWSGYSIIAVGDFNGDGFLDLVGRDSTGKMWLYRGTGTGGYLARVQFSSGWTGYTLAGDGASIPRVILPAQTGGVGDFNGDGNSDLIARDSAGNLWLYPGTGAGKVSTRVQLASGWQSMTAVVSVGDLTGDGKPDVLARDKNGTLWVYPGDGAHSLGTPIQLGSAGQFAGATAIQGVADFNGDGHHDILARDASGAVSLYPVTGNAVLGAATQLATGWQTMTSIVGVGDLNGDGNSDLVTRDASGNLWLYPGNGSGGLGSGIKISTSWNGYSIVAVGDFNHDGYLDIVGRDSAGRMWLYRGTGTGMLMARVEFSSGWTGYTLAGDGSTIPRVLLPGQIGGVGDFNSDGNSDIIARDSAGALWLYPGTGTGAISTRVQLATGFQSMTAIVSVGDITGDGKPDIVTRDGSGTLSVYPGDGAHGLGSPVTLGSLGEFANATAIQGVADFNGDGHDDLVARDSSGTLSLYAIAGNAQLGSPTQIATGWSTMTSIVGVGDFNGDGKSDLLARDSGGTLWLYPGTGSGTLGTPVKVGTGWAGLTILSVGDFNHDGAVDIVGRDSTGKMWLYRGTGTGTLAARVQFSSGWTAYTLAGDGSTIAAIPTV